MERKKRAAAHNKKCSTCSRGFWGESYSKYCSTKCARTSSVNRKYQRVKMNLRSRIRRMIRTKNGSLSALVGCNAVQLRQWLESKFKHGMAWENYGKFWVVDHRIPLASFDLENQRQRELAPVPLAKF